MLYADVTSVGEKKPHSKTTIVLVTVLVSFGVIVAALAIGFATHKS